MGQLKRAIKEQTWKVDTASARQVVFQLFAPEREECFLLFHLGIWPNQFPRLGGPNSQIAHPVKFKCKKFTIIHLYYTVLKITNPSVIRFSALGWNIWIISYKTVWASPNRIFIRISDKWDLIIGCVWKPDLSRFRTFTVLGLIGRICLGLLRNHLLHRHSYNVNTIG